MDDELMFPELKKDYSQPSTTGSNDEELKDLGKGFGIRALAYLFDALIFNFATIGTTFVPGIYIGTVGLILGKEVVIATPSFWCLPYLIGFFLVVIYFTIFEGLYGATPGKLILGMRVVKEDGSQCNLGAAFHRGLWRFIDALFFGFIAYVNMEKPLRQRLGDKKACTLVVSKNDPLVVGGPKWPRFILALVVYLAFEVAVNGIYLASLVTYY